MAVTAWLAGCQGTVTPPGGEVAPDTGIGGAEPTFACEDGAVPPDQPMNRLTRDQFDNTVRDLLSLYLGADRVEAVLSEHGPQNSLLPSDEAPNRLDNRFKRDYRRWDQAVSELHVEGWYTTALALGAELAEQDQAALLGDCGETIDCARAFLRDFAARAFRHPAPEATWARIEEVLGPVLTPTALGEAIAFVLLAPDFLYHVEEGGESVAGDTYRLTDHELAARMSYALWDSIPDEALWQAAEAGQLSGDEAALAAQVDRMLADPRSRPALTRFFEDWLQFHLAEDPSQLQTNAAYQTFAGDDMPSPGLREAGLQEVRDLLTLLTFDADATPEDLLTTDLAPVRDAELAALYGMDEPWDGTSEPPRLPEGERPGLLSRFTLLATSTVATRPVHRGVLVREILLCDKLPAPPDGASATTLDLDGVHSTREYYEILTEQPGSVCAGCHTQWINPLGFVAERYDSLARIRTEETVFDLQTGEILGTTPIDTEVSPSIFEGDTSRVSTMREMSDVIADSGKLEACMSRNLFRYMFARPEDPSVDGCALEDARAAAREGTLQDLIGAMVLSRAFRLRSIEE